MDLVVRNKIIIALMQSLLGAISPNFRAVLIDFSHGLDVKFFLDKELDEDKEEIDDVITEFDSLIMGIEFCSVTYSVTVGGGIDCSGENIVPVYIRRAQVE